MSEVVANEKVWLLQRAAKLPEGEGVYPFTQPRVHTVLLGDDGGQFPSFNGNAGVGLEQLKSVLIEQNPFPVLVNTPKLHDAERLPLATYPNAQPKLQVVPEGIRPLQLPVVLGNTAVGVEQGLGWHVVSDPDGVEKVPAQQEMGVRVDVGEGEYPL